MAEIPLSLRRSDSHCGRVHVFGFLSNATAGELSGHGLPELGVGDSVHQGVETARQLG